MQPFSEPPSIMHVRLGVGEGEADKKFRAPTNGQVITHRRSDSSGFGSDAALFALGIAANPYCWKHCV